MMIFVLSKFTMVIKHNWSFTPELLLDTIGFILYNVG